MRALRNTSSFVHFFIIVFVFLCFANPLIICLLHFAHLVDEASKSYPSGSVVVSTGSIKPLFTNSFSKSSTVISLGGILSGQFGRLQ